MKGITLEQLAKDLTELEQFFLDFFPDVPTTWMNDHFLQEISKWFFLKYRWIFQHFQKLCNIAIGNRVWRCVHLPLSVKLWTVGILFFFVNCIENSVFLKWSLSLAEDSIFCRKKLKKVDKIWKKKYYCNLQYTIISTFHLTIGITENSIACTLGI